MEEGIKNVSLELNISESRIRTAIKLMSDGATIPFIARYRKEMTGSLDEEELRKIETVYKYNCNLIERKEDVKRLIEEKGMLTPEIVDAINKAKKLNEIEDIYLPFKEKKKTKGTEAIKMGLEPLAKLIMTFPNKNKEELATPYLNDVVKTVDDAITNAGYIIADIISDNANYRKWIREFYFRTGLVKSTKKKDAVDERKLYEMYYDFEQKICDIKSYRVLAINRASKEKIVTYTLKVEDGRILDYLEKEIIGNNNFPLKEDLKLFIKDSYKRLIEPSIEREIKSDLFDHASEDGIHEFGTNLENLLLTPPIKGNVVLGFDPAFRTGCKLAVIDESGKVLTIGVIYPHEPKKDLVGATKTMLELINNYHVNIIAIGNGTASRESETFVANLISQFKLDVKYIIVSEAGASVYSASKLAIKEFPTYSVEQRSAVSIGRRLQDALSELVKIDPKSIGVGMYQHDLKANDLEEQLTYVVSKIVNKVGVNINTASESILNYVSGLSKKIITAILDYRDKHGRYKSREELKKIKGMDDFSFEQCAGFLRVLEGINPLDKTNIHPEDYKLVNQMLSDLNIDVKLVGTSEMESLLSLVKSQDMSIKYNVSIDKVDTIKDNLINGVIDPRDELKKVTLKSNVLTIDDLTVGDEIEGTVRNVAPFGAFIDIGLHDDALIHISKLSKSFVKHPSDILKVGDIITATVCDIDKDKNRVGLSLIEESNHE